MDLGDSFVICLVVSPLCSLQEQVAPETVTVSYLSRSKPYGKEDGYYKIVAPR